MVDFLSIENGKFEFEKVQNNSIGIKKILVKINLNYRRHRYFQR